MTNDLPPDPDPRIDFTRAHPARRYDYWLGGKDNFAADRESADAIERAFPAVKTAAVENRKFLHRVVPWMVREHGITQFLDIGTGLPTSPNTHEVAQAVNPAARIVYVDNDALVLAHARALLTSTTPQGRTAYIDADLRHPQRILDAADHRNTLDLSRPVGLLLIAVLHFITDDTQVQEILTELVAALAPGSMVAISHATYDPLPDDLRRKLRLELAKPHAQHGNAQPRTRAQLEDLYYGLGLQPVPPGLVSTVHWRPDLPPQPADGVTEDQAICWAWVARRT